MIYVLGTTGMLGRYVNSYLQGTGFDVKSVSRETLDASDTKDVIFKVLRTLDIKANDVLINCIGVIKQRGYVVNSSFILVNGVFPHILNEYCELNGAKLIHITTDCVFSGSTGNYIEWAIHDATDIYGKSKSIGEPTTATVIRTSIIGEEVANKKSLLEWVKSNAGKEVKGYEDHWWNGVTCLQLAKICETIIVEGLYWAGVRHIFSPDTVNKSQLISLISFVYGLNIKVDAVTTGTLCDRSLSSMYLDISFDVPDLSSQIVSIKNFKH